MFLLPLHWEWVSIYVTLTPSYIMVPRTCIDDYFQESGRGGRSGGDAHSIVYWKPIDCPIRKDLVTTRDKEVADVRRYFANTDICLRFWLLEYFDRECARTPPKK